MPRLVNRLVSQYDQPQAAQDLERTKALLAILGGYALMPALKGIMSMLSGDPAWLRVRPPLVALTPAQYSALERQVSVFGIDPARD
jgi:4-hydroxy-tetrahydrodipicolinate synthase